MSVNCFRHVNKHGKLKMKNNTGLTVLMIPYTTGKVLDIWHGLRLTFLWACSCKGLRITYITLETICNGNIKGQW